MNSGKDKLYFISKNDRQIVFEVDLRSIELKTYERKCKYSKNVDLTIIDNQLYVLNKDGWIQIHDVTKIPKYKMPKKKKIAAKQLNQS